MQQYVEDPRYNPNGIHNDDEIYVKDVNHAHSMFKVVNMYFDIGDGVLYVYTVQIESDGSYRQLSHENDFDYMFDAKQCYKATPETTAQRQDLIQNYNRGRVERYTQSTGIAVGSQVSCEPRYAQPFVGTVQNITPSGTQGIDMNLVVQDQHGQRHNVPDYRVVLYSRTRAYQTAQRQQSAQPTYQPQPEWEP